MHPDIPAPCTVMAGGLRWRVMRTRAPGAAGLPRLLLLHGTGSSWQSWAGCAPRLAADFELLVPDLPGHGGTDAFADRSASLPRMAQAVAALLRGMDWAPQLVAGHSAGAAVMAQMRLDGALPDARGLLAVNGALEPLPGLMGLVAPAVARLASRSELLPGWVTRHASQPRALTNLIASTGSRLTESAVSHYRQLLQQPDHVRGVLDMLANWQLDTLQARLPELQLPLWLVAGLADRTLAPVRSLELARRLKGAKFVPLPGLGHLAHEEAPERVAPLLGALWAQVRPAAAGDQPPGVPQAPSV
ncbi:MAG: alpha/beta fold hydrolase [Burkholderiales bacterium]|nr:MAG: alpha/beta fold hydrolase [Burkholderiales bacterium]